MKHFSITYNHLPFSTHVTFLSSIDYYIKRFSYLTFPLPSLFLLLFSPLRLRFFSLPPTKHSPWPRSWSPFFAIAICTCVTCASWKLVLVSCYSSHLCMKHASHSSSRNFAKFRTTCPASCCDMPLAGKRYRRRFEDREPKIEGKNTRYFCLSSSVYKELKEEATASISEVSFSNCLLLFTR